MLTSASILQQAADPVASNAPQTLNVKLFGHFQALVTVGHREPLRKIIRQV